MPDWPRSTASTGKTTELTELRLAEPASFKSDTSSVSVFRTGRFEMANEPGGGDGRKELPQHPLVDSLKPDPGQPTKPVTILTGLPGKSDRAGYQRLYLTTKLDYYAEFLASDMVHWELVPADRSPFPGVEATRVSIVRDATIHYIWAKSPRPVDEFDLDIRLGGPSAATAPAIGPHTLPDNTVCLTCAGTCDETCGRTCETCAGEQTCRTCHTCAGQQTCQTCQTCAGQQTCQTCAGQNTCQTCVGQQTCQTCAGQNTCQTCVGQQTCQTCHTCAGQQTCQTCHTCATCRTCDGQATCFDTCFRTCATCCGHPNTCI
jgi:hypothetical protein